MFNDKSSMCRISVGNCRHRSSLGNSITEIPPPCIHAASRGGCIGYYKCIPLTERIGYDLETRRWPVKDCDSLGCITQATFRGNNRKVYVMRTGRESMIYILSRCCNRTRKCPIERCDRKTIAGG